MGVFVWRLPELLSSEEVLWKNAINHFKAAYPELDLTTVQACEEAIISFLLENIEEKAPGKLPLGELLRQRSDLVVRAPNELPLFGVSGEPEESAEGFCESRLTAKIKTQPFFEIVEFIEKQQEFQRVGSPAL